MVEERGAQCLSNSSDPGVESRAAGRPCEVGCMPACHLHVPHKKKVLSK